MPALPRLTTSSVAAGLGLSRSAIRHQVRQGRWVALARGIYLTVPGPPTWLDRVGAAVLATGGVASHTTAARLHGFGSAPCHDLVHVTVPATNRRARTGTRLHVHPLRPDEVVVRHGLPVSAPLRTALDCARTLPPAHGAASLEALVRTTGTAWAELAAAVERASGAGSRRLRRALALADPRSESLLETQVRILLGTAGLPPPELQHEVHLRGRRYRLDLAYPGARLAVEVDGWAHHADRVQFQRDRSRQNDLVLAGWTILRVTAEDLHRRPASLVAAVRAALSGDRFDVAVAGPR